MQKWVFEYKLLTGALLMSHLFSPVFAASFTLLMRRSLLTWTLLPPLQLLKGVGTKCWAPDAEYALHSVYQGGLFELRAGDELFVSVSSPTMVNADDSSSYFGAFRLDL